MTHTQWIMRMMVLTILAMLTYGAIIAVSWGVIAVFW